MLVDSACNMCKQLGCLNEALFHHKKALGLLGCCCCEEALACLGKVLLTLEPPEGQVSTVGQVSCSTTKGRREWLEASKQEPKKLQAPRPQLWKDPSNERCRLPPRAKGTCCLQGLPSCLQLLHQEHGATEKHDCACSRPRGPIKKRALQGPLVPTHQTG